MNKKVWKAVFWTAAAAAVILLCRFVLPYVFTVITGIFTALKRI